MFISSVIIEECFKQANSSKGNLKMIFLYYKYQVNGIDLRTDLTII